MNKEATHPIDFVIPWVDGDDPAWQACRDAYLSTSDEAALEFRFRDWGLLKYWFRGIEKFSPWVNKVHFITWGHTPEWLNKDCPKLNIVRHEDFIPNQWLPTFSSHPIELNIHRINGLTDHFVYFNDDTFLISPVRKTDFFKNGLPCSSAILMPFRTVKNDWFTPPINNVAILNEHFAARKTVRENFLKWVNPKYGRLLFSSLLMMPYPFFYGFKELHIPNSFLKSTFEEVWSKEEEILSETSSHKFRDRTDVNQWLMENWQFAKGSFVPRSVKFGKTFYLWEDTLARTEELSQCITNQSLHVICINDGDIQPDHFEIVKNQIHAAFEQILPDASEFEIR